MRECHTNYAHGPMKLRTTNIVVEYGGQSITCEKIVYACNICGFELHEKWMEEKLNDQLMHVHKQQSS